MSAMLCTMNVFPVPEATIQKSAKKTEFFEFVLWEKKLEISPVSPVSSTCTRD
jgi:hypothetical protein